MNQIPAVTTYDCAHEGFFLADRLLRHLDGKLARMVDNGLDVDFCGFPGWFGGCRLCEKGRERGLFGAFFGGRRRLVLNVIGLVKRLAYGTHVFHIGDDVFCILRLLAQGESLAVGAAGRCDGTLAAVGLWSAYRAAQLHERLSPTPWPITPRLVWRDCFVVLAIEGDCIHELLRGDPDQVNHRLVRFNVPVQAQLPAQHAQHVAVDHGRRPPKRDAGDCARRVASYTGNLVREVLCRRRQQAPHGRVADGQLGGLVDARRAAVVAQAAPRGEHVVGAGSRQVLDRRPPLHPPVPVFNHDGDARLLQHNLADPDLVRALLERPAQRGVIGAKFGAIHPWLAPRHRARRAHRVEPGQEAGAAVGAARAVEEQRLVVRERVASRRWQARLEVRGGLVEDISVRVNSAAGRRDSLASLGGSRRGCALGVAGAGRWGRAGACCGPARDGPRLAAHNKDSVEVN